MIGNEAASMPRTSIICGVHSVFHLALQRLKRRRVGAVHDPRPGLCGRRVRAFGWRRDQRLDVLVSEADDLIGPHVAADHPVRQARLKRLIDDAAAPCEIGLAARHEFRSGRSSGTLPRCACSTRTSAVAGRPGIIRPSIRPGRHCPGSA